MSIKDTQPLFDIQIPPEHSREHLTPMIGQAVLGEVRANVPFIREVAKIVNSPEFQALIDEGKITYGMIKPRLHESADMQFIGMGDAELAQEVMNHIQSPLEVAFSFSFVMPPQLIEQFYEGRPKDSQVVLPAIDPNRYGQFSESRWDEMKALFTSGPVTALLLYEPNGTAIKTWREQMGRSWNVEVDKKEHPHSLRAIFPSLEDKNHNNFVYGSDSIDSVKRELSLILNL